MSRYRFPILLSNHDPAQLILAVVGRRRAPFGAQERRSMRYGVIHGAMAHPHKLAVAATRSRYDNTTSCSSISGPLDVLVPIPSSPDLSYSQSSSPMPASSSPVCPPPSLRMYTPDLPPSSPIPSSSRSFWHVALNDEPGLARRKPVFKSYSHASSSTSPIEAAFLQNDGREFFPSLRTRRRSSSESAPPLISDAEPSEFSDDIDMIEDFGGQSNDDPFRDLHPTAPIIQMDYSDPIYARISDASTQMYSKHHQLPGFEDSALTASDYDIATALLDLKRHVRISSKSSRQTTDLSTSSRASTNCLEQITTSEPCLPSHTEITASPGFGQKEISEGQVDAPQENSCHDIVVKVEEAGPDSEQALLCKIEVLSVGPAAVGEVAEAAAILSFSISDNKRSSGEELISELSRSPRHEARSEMGFDDAAASPDGSLPLEDSLLDPPDVSLTGCTAEVNSDPCADVVTADSPAVTKLPMLVDDSEAEERRQIDASVAAASHIVESDILSHAVSPDLLTEVSLSHPTDEALAESTSIYVSAADSTSSLSQSLEGVNPVIEAPLRKSKPKRDDENATCQQPKKRRRRPATTVLSESLVMNSRSASLAPSEASSLSPLSGDEEDFRSFSRDCQPVKKRRRKGYGTEPAPTSHDVLPAVGPVRSEQAGDLGIEAAESTLGSKAADVQTQAEIRGFLIQAMALSRASSMPASSLLREVLREQPQLIHQRSKEDWLLMIEDSLSTAPGCDVFGHIDRYGTDAADRPLEAQWFYIPENDEDQDRAALLREMMPKKRTATKSHKQYYYRPLGKMSRWDAEEDA